jgi:hypothetical protein
MRRTSSVVSGQLFEAERQVQGDVHSLLHQFWLHLVKGFDIRQTDCATFFLSHGAMVIHCIEKLEERHAIIAVILP